MATFKLDAKLDAILQVSQMLAACSPINPRPFGPGLAFNTVQPSLSGVENVCDPALPALSLNLVPELTVRTPLSCPQTSKRRIVLGNGTCLVFSEDDVPDLPTTSFVDNTPHLNRMWDDTSPYWDGKSILMIHGHPVPVSRWPDVYKQWRSGDWDMIKSNFVDWKASTRVSPCRSADFVVSSQAVVERFRRGTPEAFWQEFVDDKGRYLSFTAIAAHLTAECLEESRTLAKRARTEYGDEFDSMFSYRKGSAYIVMKDPTKIANRYRQLKG
jgi:hypothetical protein